MFLSSRVTLARFLLLACFLLCFSTSFASATFAFPGGSTNLKAQVCSAEVSSASVNNFATTCSTGSYPADCPSDRVSCNDGSSVLANVVLVNQYMGIRVSDYNSSVSNCGAITSVKLCYEWWVLSSSINTCTVTVDADGGTSYSTASTTCPGTASDPGEICTDVTGLESWTCANFFNATGTRALGAVQVRSVTTGGFKSLTVDSLYFNVTYSEDATPPSVNISGPQNTTYASLVSTLNSTASDSIFLQSCWYSLDNGVTNTTFTCNTNLTGLTSSAGVNTWKVWANDSSGNENSTNVTFTVYLDTTAPSISAITSVPNTTAALDPNVVVYVNATVNEDFNISRVVLMYQENATGVWNYVTMTNNSNLVLGGNSTIVYNASFTPTNGTWIFAINATDIAGNQAVSANTTAIVTLDNSFANSTDIAYITSFTYAQLASNNFLGVLYLNNTGDSALVFDVNVSSALGSRFNINYTSTQNTQYGASAGANLSLNFTLDTTGLTSGLYAYNISINSTVGSTLLQKYVNIQTSAAPYLVVTITNYSSSVSASQSNVVMVSTVSNFGTQDASGVYLNWTLPAYFSISSGSLSSSVGSLVVGASGSNSITFDVSSSPSSSSAIVFANATAGNSASSSDATLSLSVANAVITVPTSSGVASSRSLGDPVSAVLLALSETIEIVRNGLQANFEIVVSPPQPNTSLSNLTVALFGLPVKYFEISPLAISRINTGENHRVYVSIHKPSYESYEELPLNAIISGKIVSATGVASPYLENRSIKLIIQEVSREQAEAALIAARAVIDKMYANGYSTIRATATYQLAKEKLNQRRNKESLDLSNQIIESYSNAKKTELTQSVNLLLNIYWPYLLAGSCAVILGIIGYIYSLNRK